MDFTFDLSNVALADSGSCELRQEQDVNTDEWVNICALVTFTWHGEYFTHGASH